MAKKRTRTLAYFVAWGAMFGVYQIVNPEVNVYVELAIIFGLMPIVAGVIAWIFARPWVDDAGTGLPVHRGDDTGYSIRLRDDLEGWREVNRVQGLLLLSSESVGRVDKEVLVAGVPVFTGVPEEELQRLVDQFKSRGISVDVERGSLPG